MAFNGTTSMPGRAGITTRGFYHGAEAPAPSCIGCLAPDGRRSGAFCAVPIPGCRALLSLKLPVGLATTMPEKGAPLIASTSETEAARDLPRLIEPELLRVFSNPPAYGYCGFRFVFHVGEVMKIEQSVTMLRGCRGRTPLPPCHGVFPGQMADSAAQDKVFDRPSEFSIYLDEGPDLLCTSCAWKTGGRLSMNGTQLAHLLDGYAREQWPAMIEKTLHQEAGHRL